MNGYLLKKGSGSLPFRTWSKRYVEIVEDSLRYSVMKGSFQTEFKLGPQTRFEDSSVRHFCFCLSDPGSESLYFAAENNPTKEAWAEQIQSLLMQIRLKHNRKALSDGDITTQTEFTNQYQNRPILYIKIIKARDLLNKENNGLPDPYINICVGSSTVRTTTRKKTLNPEWGMVFNFDWDHACRYAKIEVWSEESEDFLGVVYLPLLPLRDGQSIKLWYPVSKRSSKSHVRGEIEIEVSCSGQPAAQHLAWQLFREIQRLPCMTIQLVQQSCQSQGSSAPALESARFDNECVQPINLDLTKSLGFPFYFPPIETEALEDISIRVHLASSSPSCKVINKGVLLFTNYRLIFVSNSKLISSSRKQRLHHALEQADLTTHVPLGCIVSVQLNAESDSINNGMVAESLRIKTSDHRVLNFVFRDDPDVGAIESGLALADWSPSTPINNASVHDDNSAESYEAQLNQSIASDNNGDSASRHGSTDGRGNVVQLSDLEIAWRSICVESSHIIDAASSDEGSPGQRFYKRLNILTVNKCCQHQTMLKMHSELLSCLSERVFQEPDQSSGPTESVEECSSSSSTPNLQPSEGSEVAVGSASDLLFDPDHLPMGWSRDMNEIRTPETADEAMELSSSLITYKLRVRLASLATCRALRNVLLDGWDVFTHEEEYRRMGIPDWLWRLSPINDDYIFSPTYPSCIAVPANTDDCTLMGSQVFRSKGRLPVVVWRNSGNNCSISRCSQPMVGITQARSVHDEQLIQDLNHNGGLYVQARYLGDDISGQPFVIMDARPLLNATAMQAAGKGFESEKFYENTVVSFQDIANIHAVRKSLEMLEEACMDESNWLRNVEASGWLTHIWRILTACTKCVHYLAYEEKSVLVHCSDGWDRTAQLSSLSMMMLDPFYRTTKGFIVLIEKEWVSFGHKFKDRLAWTNNGWKDDEKSPIFHQFLDCVHQCLIQTPNAYEFNEAMLLFILEHLHSGWFGNFLFNCEKERQENSDTTISIWTAVLSNPNLFVNKSYFLHSGPVIPAVTKQRIAIWSKYFLRWQDRVWHLAWLGEDS